MAGFRAAVSEKGMNCTRQISSLCPASLRAPEPRQAITKSELGKYTILQSETSQNGPKTPYEVSNGCVPFSMEREERGAQNPQRCSALAFHSYSKTNQRFQDNLNHSHSSQKQQKR
jgi:hypothetical protein